MTTREAWLYSIGQLRLPEEDGMMVSFQSISLVIGHWSLVIPSRIGHWSLVVGH
jgi:hypothetical protein